MDSADRSLPRHSKNGAKRSRANSLGDARLSVIVEDGAIPAVPEKSRNNRTFSRGWAFNPPRHSFEESPPNYSFWDVTGPKGERLTDVRNNKYIAQRGGWRRICLIFFVVLAVILALAIGLGVGLRKQQQQQQQQQQHTISPTASAAAPTSTPTPSVDFPVGSYRLNTFLERVSTNCTSNSTTWSCPPYYTYDNSQSQSAAPLDWVISPSAPGSPTNLSISSSPNPFSITFTNASLELVDQNLMTERYTFTTAHDKTVNPFINVACYFNGTTLKANMYTRLKQIYPDTSYSSTVSSAAPASTGGVYNGGQLIWPYAVELTQSIGGGTGVPDCYRLENGNPVEHLTQGLKTKGPDEVCSCFYKNFNS